MWPGDAGRRGCPGLVHFCLFWLPVTLSFTFLELNLPEKKNPLLDNLGDCAPGDWVPRMDVLPCAHSLQPSYCTHTSVAALRAVVGSKVERFVQQFSRKKVREKSHQLLGSVTHAPFSPQRLWRSSSGAACPFQSLSNP